MTKSKNCPLLVKYGVDSQQAAENRQLDWVKEICLHCPCPESCIYDIKISAKTRDILFELARAVIPPKGSHGHYFCRRCNGSVRPDVDRMICLSCGTEYKMLDSPE